VTLPIPAASDPTEIVADWIEYEALRSKTRSYSLQSLVRVIRRSGSVDAFQDERGDIGSQHSQRVAQDAFGEIENRAAACGVDGYPFEVKPGLIRLKAGGDTSPYVLLLLLSAAKPTSGHSGTAVLFERICCHAAFEYLGGSQNQAKVLRFGAPRKTPVGQFHQAISHLCIEISEGGGCKHPEKGKHTGDDGLDIVAWRGFPDAKEGQLIVFGQCAGGLDRWEKKLMELDGQKFVRKWFRNMLVVDPVRAFFVPRRIPRDDWEHSGIEGGILFDRCRIVACLQALDRTLTKECARIARSLVAKARKK
jgi:hypothetical protein